MKRDAAFAHELLTLNEQRLRWLAPLLTAVVGVNTVLNFRFESGRDWAARPDNLVWLLAALLFWLANLRYGRPSKPLMLRHALVLAFAALTLAMGTARFVSYLHFGVVPTYVVCVMAVAMAVVMRPAMFVSLFATSYLLFCVAVLAQAALPPVVKQIILRSSATATLLAALLSLLLYRAQQAQFAQTLEVRAANERLSHLNEELQRRHQEMNEVMAMTAHDLRSPLFGLKNLLALGANKSDYDAERLRLVMTAAVDACDDLLALLTRMLEAHEAEQQSRLPLRRQDLRPVFHVAARRAAALAATKGIEIDLDLPREPLEAPCNAEALMQVLDNLLSNAVKFSPPNSRVGLRLFEAEGVRQAEVRDQGPGVPDGEREHLFRKFRRGSAIATGGEPRTGMGLFIAHRRMESLGGSLHYVGKPGCGAAFRLRFGRAGY